MSSPQSLRLTSVWSSYKVWQQLYKRPLFWWSILVVIFGVVGLWHVYVTYDTALSMASKEFWATSISLKERPQSNHFTLQFFHIKHAIMLCSKSEWHDTLLISSLFSSTLLFPRLQRFILGLSVKKGGYFIWTAAGTSFFCSLGDLDYKDKMMKTFLHLKH